MEMKWLAMIIFLGFLIDSLEGGKNKKITTKPSVTKRPYLYAVQRPNSPGKVYKVRERTNNKISLPASRKDAENFGSNISPAGKDNDFRRAGTKSTKKYDKNTDYRLDFQKVNGDGRENFAVQKGKATHATVIGPSGFFDHDNGRTAGDAMRHSLKSGNIVSATSSRASSGRTSPQRKNTKKG